MIRLIHQFDDHRTRPMAASPKSEMCSCCCCCSVVTVVGAGVLTARSVGRAPREGLPPAEALALGAPQEKRVGARVLAFLLLPAALGVGCLVGSVDVTAGFVVGVAAYVLGLWALMAKAALPRWTFVLVLLVPAVAALEGFVWLETLFK